MAIYLTDFEKRALAAVDKSVLSEAISKALKYENLAELHQLKISECGPYLATELSHFEKALREYKKSKSIKKRERTYSDAYRAGSRLSFAASSMKQRMEIEDKERQFFIISDDVQWPLHLSDKLTVRVDYQWRQTTEDTWLHSSIIFHHNVIRRPEYGLTPPKTKLSASKQAKKKSRRNFPNMGTLCQTSPLFGPRLFSRSRSR